MWSWGWFLSWLGSQEALWKPVLGRAWCTQLVWGLMEVLVTDAGGGNLLARRWLVIVGKIHPNVAAEFIQGWHGSHNGASPSSEQRLFLIRSPCSFQSSVSQWALPWGEWGSPVSYVLNTSYITPLKHRRALRFSCSWKEELKWRRWYGPIRSWSPVPSLGSLLDTVLVPEKRQDDALIYTVFLRYHNSKWCHGLYAHTLSLASHLPLTTCLKPLFVRLLWEP